MQDLSKNTAKQVLCNGRLIPFFCPVITKLKKGIWQLTQENLDHWCQTLLCNHIFQSIAICLYSMDEFVVCKWYFKPLTHISVMKEVMKVFLIKMTCVTLR